MREAEECLSELDSRGRQGENVNTWKLHVHVGLGNSDQVMEHLKNAFQEQSVSLVFMLKHPLLDSVREDARFADPLRRMKLDHLVGYRPDPPWTPDSSQ